MIEIATNYFEHFTKGEGRQIFDASMKVVKALNYDMKKLKSFCTKMRISDHYTVFYLIIVFEGNLYKCSFEEGEEVVSHKIFAVELRLSRQVLSN